jgi:hypothetical protein
VVIIPPQEAATPLGHSGQVQRCPSERWLSRSAPRGAGRLRPREQPFTGAL